MTGLLLAVVLAAAGEPFAWPLDLPRELTSSFGEYRPGRFHAGIDLRTGGVGPPVAAARDGYVSRIRCSPYGYGKAVYLQLDDGHSVVYGHLNGFNDALTAYVRAAQHAAKNYTVDLTPSVGQFRVRRGEVFAFAGQTGIGAPHLHYELRDGDAPVNPALLGVSWQDTVKPVITQAALFPHPEDGLLNGDLKPVILTPSATGEGAWATPPVAVRGRFAVAVDFVDPAAGDAKLGARIVRLMHVGAEIFRVQHDRLSYSANNSTVAYDPYLQEQGRFLRLHRWQGNDAPSYAVSRGDGWVPGPKANTVYRVEVTDFQGNTAVLSIPVVPAGPAPAAPAAPAAMTMAAPSVACWGDALTLSLVSATPEPETPLWTATCGTKTTPLAALRIDDQSFRARFLPKTPGRYVLHVNHPRAVPFEEAVAVFLRGVAGQEMLGEVQLRAVADTAYSVLCVRVEEVRTPPAAPVTAHGKTYRLWPDSAPIDAPLRVSFPAPAGNLDWRKVSVYRQQGSSWSPVKTERTEGRLVIETRSLGLFRVLEDQTAPYLGRMTPEADGPVTGRRPSIQAMVKDQGSGIARVEGWCDAQWLLMAYDPERELVAWEQDVDLPPGERRLRLRAIDEAGNETVEERAVFVP
jgi:hypothetical protein